MAREPESAEEDSEHTEDDDAGSTDLLDVSEEERGTGPDLLRKLMTFGLSGLFTTESAIRGALGDTVPREWVDFVSEQSDRTRDEFLARLATEFVHVLENVDVVDLAEQLLEGRTVEVKAEFKLGPRTSSEAKPARTPRGERASEPSESDERDERS